NGLKDELVKNRIDILKINTTQAEKDLFVKLDKLGYNYYLLGAQIEYKAVFKKNVNTKFRNSQIKIIEYKGGDANVLKTLVKDVFKNNYSSYFQNPGIIGLVDDKTQLDCFAEYILTLNSANKENHFTHLFYLDNILVGFICSYVDGIGSGALYSGILKKYENRGLYLDIIQFIQAFGKEKGSKWGTATVQLQNIVGQKSFIAGGMSPNGYSLNIHINAFEGIECKT
ncbi:MAG: hypothetical protein ACPGLV_16910, partial [Bacteroidia bacterium]